jgi:hypothetical protein
VALEEIPDGGGAEGMGDAPELQDEGHGLSWVVTFPPENCLSCMVELTQNFDIYHPR